MEPNVNGAATRRRPRREPHFSYIMDFLKANVNTRGNGYLYASGVPGTGKTTTVLAAVEEFQKFSIQKNGYSPRIVYINWLSVLDPNDPWLLLYQQLTSTKETLTGSRASVKLNLYFRSSQREPTILVFDEFDHLFKTKQLVLKDLMECLDFPSCVFSLICIDNNLVPFPEGICTATRNFKQKVLTCEFPSYNKDELEGIVLDTLEPEDITLLGRALPTLCSKVAKISGDARAALNISTRTLEIVKSTDGTSSLLALVDALREQFQSLKIKALRDCTKLEKLVLKRIYSYYELEGHCQKETSLCSVMNSVMKVGKNIGLDICEDDVFGALGRLSLARLIILKPDNPTFSNTIHGQVTLNVDAEDLSHAFREKLN